MNRFFNHKQKKILFSLSGGVCQICGNDLGKDWEADHVQPWSDGGKTIIENGQALCASCNRKKGNKMNDSNFALRSWQQQAFNDFKSKLDRQNSYLLVAGVGSGKTLWASMVANYLLNDRGFDSVVVVSNTENIKINWQQNFLRNFGIQLDIDYPFRYDWRQDFSGISITYQSLNDINTEFLRRRVNKGTLLIIDEAHHAGDNKAWGSGIVSVGDNCGFVLLLSGTPTRSDNSRIPFVTYESIDDDQYRLKSDFYYSYAQSVQDKYCCPVRFHKIAGEINLVGGVRSLTYDEDETESRFTINRALEARGEQSCFVWQMFEKASDELSRINDRRGENYAGLVVCNTIRDANVIYKQICAAYGPSFVELVTSDEKDSNAKINDFKNSSTPWIVSVNMISEGVDISRIRVIVYATNTTTPLFFTQVIGRGVRNAVHLKNDIDTCHVFIPEYRPIVDNANAIEKELIHVVSDIEKEVERLDRIPGGRQSPLMTFDDIVLSATAINNGSIFSGSDLNNEDVSYLENLANVNHVTVETVMSIIAGYQKRKVNEKKAEVSLVKSTSERKRDLRKEISRIVGRIASLSDTIDFREVHYAANKSVGIIKTDAASMNQLERKLEYLVNWLNEDQKRVI